MGGIATFPDVLDRGDAFVEVVDLPPLSPISGVRSSARMCSSTIRMPGCFRRVRPLTAPWHSDLANVWESTWHIAPASFSRCITFFEDLRPDQGCLAFIPGSHRFPIPFLARRSTIR